MLRGYAFVLVGLGAFLVFLVAGLPAGVAYGWLPANAVKMAGVTGTVWNGGARQLAAGGLNFGETSWNFRLFGLLSGELSYSFDTRVQGLPVTGIAGVRMNGHTHLRSLRGKVSIRAFDNLAPTGFFDGAAEFNLTDLELDNGWPVTATGSVAIENLRFLAAQPPLALGSFEVTFAEADMPPVRGTIADTAGGLAIDAQLVLKEDRCYELDGTAALQPGAKAELQKVLAYLGPAGADGKRVIERRDCL